MIMSASLSDIYTYLVKILKSGKKARLVPKIPFCACCNYFSPPL